MTAFNPSRSELRTIQKRRKAVIQTMVVLVLPLLAVFDGLADPASLQRQGIELFGLFLVVVGILGRAWSALYIGGRKSRELVVSGPYSVSRNPLYLFSFIAIGGVGAQTGSVVVALLFVLGSWLVFHPVISHEEDLLRYLFPDQYGRYAARVPRLMPDLSRWSDIARLDIDPRLYRKTVLDSLVLLAAVLPIRLLALLHANEILPVWLRLP